MGEPFKKVFMAELIELGDNEETGCQCNTNSYR